MASFPTIRVSLEDDEWESVIAALEIAGNQDLATKISKRFNVGVRHRNLYTTDPETGETVRKDAADAGAIAQEG